MHRFPVIITLGAALLGWVAGEMALTDPSTVGFVAHHDSLHKVLPALGAAVVVAAGKWLSTRGQESQAATQPAA